MARGPGLSQPLRPSTPGERSEAALPRFLRLSNGQQARLGCARTHLPPRKVEDSALARVAEHVRLSEDLLELLLSAGLPLFCP